MRRAFWDIWNRRGMIRAAERDIMRESWSISGHIDSSPELLMKVLKCQKSFRLTWKRAHSHDVWILIGCKNRADPTESGVDEGLWMFSSAVQVIRQGRSETTALFFYTEIFLLLIFNHSSETEEERVRIAGQGQKMCLRRAGVHVTQQSQHSVATLIGTHHLYTTE